MCVHCGFRTVRGPLQGDAPGRRGLRKPVICVWTKRPTRRINDTYRVKIGILGSFGAPVYGAEAAVITASSGALRGFKGSLVYTNGTS